MKITFKRGYSAVSIHAAKVTLDKGRIVYHRTPGSPGDEITLKDESLTIEDDAQEPCTPIASLLHKPVSLMPKPRAPFAAACIAAAGILGTSSASAAPLFGDSAAWDAPLPLWLAIPVFFFALAVFYLATVKLSDSWAARKPKPKPRKDSTHHGDGSILPALVTTLAVITIFLGLFGIYSVGHDEWKTHVTTADLRAGAGTAGLFLLCCGLAYLCGRNDQRHAHRADAKRLKLPPQL